MEIEVNQNVLTKALSLVSRCVSTKASLPILANIHLHAQGKQLTLSATNLETGISHTIPATVKTSGEITVPARILGEFVSSLPVQPIHLLVDGLTLSVACGKHKATIAGMSAKEFPDIPQLVGQPTISIPTKFFSEAIHDVSFAAAADEGRPVLTGVLFDLSQEALTLVATDGYRLSHQKIPLGKKKEEQLQVIVPAKALGEVARLMEENKNNETVDILLTKEQNQMIFRGADVTFVSRLIDGTFPNWQKVIPEKGTTNVTIPMEEFAAAVHLAAVFARDAANVVKLAFDPSGISVSSSAKELGEQASVVETKVAGERNEIAFNVRYLADLLAHVKADEMQFSMSEPLLPGLFRLAKKPHFLHVIMPIRMQG